MNESILLALTGHPYNNFATTSLHLENPSITSAALMTAIRKINAGGNCFTESVKALEGRRLWQRDIIMMDRKSVLGKFCDVLDELRTDMDYGKYVDGALQKLADLHLVKTVGSVHHQKSTNHDREMGAC